MTNLTTSPPSPRASPDAVVDRLFAKLYAMYGKAWLDMWADGDVAAVKASWAESLRNTTVEQMRLALEQMEKTGAKFPPSLPEFRAVCEQYRVRAKPSLYLTAPRTEAPAETFRTLRKILEQAGK